MAPLSRDEREVLRTRLAERAEELRVSLARPDDETAAVTPDAAIGRLTRVDAMQMGHMTMALRRQKAQELLMVERALAAVVDGTYGTCQRCGDDIARARLDARPAALLCVACADANAPRR